MHHLDAIDAAARQRSAAYAMEHARARYREDLNPRRRSFRAWARATYNAPGCTGKLAAIVQRKAVA